MTSTTTSTAEHAAMGASYSEFQAEELLKGIASELDKQLEKEVALEQSIEHQGELAMARYSNGTAYGATLCLNKLERIRNEKERVHSAIGILEMHATQVAARLEDARSRMKKQGSEISLELSAHSRYHEDVTKVLTFLTSSQSPPPRIQRQSSHRLVIEEYDDGDFDPERPAAGVDDDDSDNDSFA